MDLDEGDILECDVLVVGGGPLGSTAARFAAKNCSGRVIVIEKRQEIGSPVRCAEGISLTWFDELEIEKSEHFINKKVLGAKLYSPSGDYMTIGKEMAGDEVGAVVERDTFDKEMAVLAGREGVDYILKASAVDVIEKSGVIKGVKARKMGNNFEIHADLVIGADGFESQIGRWAGLYAALPPEDIMSCFQYRMTNIDIDADYTHFFLGSDAPGGYIWIFPKDKDSANVGIGIQLSKLDGSNSPKEYLDNFIKKNDWLNQGQEIDMVSGGVSVSSPPDRVTRDGLMLVGDASRIVDPITGGGIANGMKQAKIAGEVAAEAIELKDTSEKFLQKYEKRWRKRLENKLWRNYMAKEKAVQLEDEEFDMIIDALSDEDIDEMSTEAILVAVGEKYPELVESFKDML